MNGKVHQEIYLGSPNRYKFKHIDWETHGETIILQSLHNHSHPQLTQPAARSKPRVLITIAVFAMFPLQFKGMLEIDRAIFGKECNHANVSEGLLIVGTGSTLTGAVRLYNFRNILEEINQWNSDELAENGSWTFPIQAQSQTPFAFILMTQEG
ncbi:hypothetical protein HPB49_025182 [Dermacentor silvarum]|uniref:Uncharacterized protein n=1 Tax=Dermacentor silvarum TaxID=543639 RepID=A0ACB8D9A5_DERSI|nr:hypothetical protein HPB49_025182 [Dermacentor silvarum]